MIIVFCNKLMGREERKIQEKLQCSKNFKNLYLQKLV
jgi:hypothetical protein